MTEPIRILVENVSDGDSIPSHLLFLSGRLVSERPITFPDKIACRNQTSGGSSRPLEWSVCRTGGQFKALVDLVPGDNTIRLWTKHCRLLLRVTRPEVTTDRFVRLLYVLSKEGDGTFQVPEGEDDSVESALARIRLAAKLLQVFTSENLHQHGLPRKTFRLETEPGSDEPTCHLFRLRLTTAEAWELSDRALWGHIKDELARSDFSEKNGCKFAAFLSFTRYEIVSDTWPSTHKEVLSRTRGHAALGGGGLAMFGCGCLHTWAPTLGEVHERLADTREVDREVLMDDSANRGTYGCCYATGMGAVLHELGHTWDLLHASEGVMDRGFDDMDKFFLREETRPAGSKTFQRAGPTRLIRPERQRIPRVVTTTHPSDTRILSNKWKEPATEKNFSSDKLIEHFSDKMTVSRSPLTVDKAVPKPIKENSISSANINTDNLQGNRGPGPEVWQPKLETMKRQNGNCYWDRASAVWLWNHRLVSDTLIGRVTDGRGRESWNRFRRWFNSASDVTFNKDSLRLDGLELKSEHGISIIVLTNCEKVLCHWEFVDPGKQTRFHFKPAEVLKWNTDQVVDLMVRVEDSFGNMLIEPLPSNME